MDRYLEIDTETDEILANIAEIAANVGKFLKSPKLLLVLLGRNDRGKGWLFAKSQKATAFVAAHYFAKKRYFEFNLI